MTKHITYAQLFDRLKGLGFMDRTMERNGSIHHVFKHKEIETATIFLPERPLHQSVDPMHLAAVRAVLKVHDLAPNEQEQAFF